MLKVLEHTNRKKSVLDIFKSTHSFFLIDACAFIIEDERSLLESLYEKSEFLAKIKLFSEEFDSEEKIDSRNHYQMYNTLLKYNWIIEIKKDVETYVEISPYAKSIIDFIENFEQYNKVSYGQEIIKVISLLEFCSNNLEQSDEAIKSAFSSSKLFISHLKRISSHIHLYEKIFEEENNINNVIFEFFENYMERNFIDDFKKIKTTESPFIFRSRIQTLCESLSHKVNSNDSRHSLFEIQKLFSNIDQYLDILDKASQRIEKKINNTIKFMNEISQVNSDIIVNALKAIGDNDTNWFLLNELDIALPESPDSLFEERQYHSKKEVTVIKSSIKNEAFELRQQKIGEYFQVNHITIPKIVAFLEKITENRKSARGRDIKISSLYDFFIIERIRSLSFIEKKNLESRWLIQVLDEQISNEWIECNDFMVSRR